jgi:hypothetical protein
MLTEKGRNGSAISSTTNSEARKSPIFLQGTSKADSEAVLGRKNDYDATRVWYICDELLPFHKMYNHNVCIIQQGPNCRKKVDSSWFIESLDMDFSKNLEHLAKKYNNGELTENTLVPKWEPVFIETHFSDGTFNIIHIIDGILGKKYGDNLPSELVHTLHQSLSNKVQMFEHTYGIGIDHIIIKRY